MDRLRASGLLIYDMIATVDAEWFSRNATKVFDAAARTGQAFHRGMASFEGVLDEIGVPDFGEDKALFTPPKEAARK